MHWRKILVLTLVAAGLGVGLWRERARSQGGAGEPFAMLFEGLDADRLVAIRIEQLERSWTARFDRAGLQWRLVDPIEYPAEVGRMHQLVELMRRERVRPAPQVEPAEVGLDPPRVRLVGIEARPEGERTTAIEIGDEDVDPRLVWVRVNGAVRLASRSVLSSVDYPLDEFRHSRIPAPRPEELVRVVRAGSFAVDPDTDELTPVDLELNCALSPPQLLRPLRAPLDPSTLGGLLRIATGIDVQGFVSDIPGAGASFGLDEPLYTLELETRAGTSSLLAFGSAPGDAELPFAARRWLVAQEGWDTVWEVKYGVLRALAIAPLELLDYDVVRVPREQVVRLEVRGPLGNVELRRPADIWVLEEAPGVSARRAEQGRVDELLSLLDRAEVGQYLPEVEFLPEDVRGAFTLELGTGELQGGELGAAHTTPEGVAGVLYRRAGESCPLLLDAELLGLLEFSSDDLRSLHAVSVAETEIASITIGLAGETGISWVRDERGRWMRAGIQIEDREFAPEVDRVRSLRVSGWGVGAPEEGLEEAVTVVLSLRARPAVSYTLGRLAGTQEVVLELEGERATPRDPGLHALFLGLAQRGAGD